MNELFGNILTASFHGSIVILAVIALRLVLKKTPKKFLCLLWLLAGIRLLMPFEIRSDLSLQPDREALSRTVAEEFRPEPVREDLPDMMPAVPEDAAMPEDVEASYGDAFTPPEGENPTPGEQSLYDASYPEEPETAAVFDWMAIVPWLWLAVASCFAVYSVYSYVHLKLQVREAIKIPGGWECDRIDTAFILGFIKPKIYIPMGMSKAVRRHILAHERTHLEKGDHWIKMIGFLALALHWFNPLVWVAYILLCKDIEMACDERVVQFMDLDERKSYSAALLSCSTNRAHFAACPVAFGEVSVKYRIKSVLNYRKPSFWISLLGVIAIGFVAVCLVTSPTENEEVPAAGETISTEPTEETVLAETTAETEVASTYAATLDQSDIVQVCIDAINKLCQQESYCISVESSSVYPEREDGVYPYSSIVRRYGKDSLDLYFTQLDNEEPAYTGSTLYFGDMYGVHYGDFWVNEGTRNEETDVNAWLKEYSPEGKTVTFPEGTGVISDDSVSFAMEWTHSYSREITYYGTITFTFHNDGTLSKISRRYELHVEGYEEEEPCYFTTDLYILEENPSDTYNTIAEHAGQCIPADQLEKVRAEREKITEIPSNKTEYDKNFMLGSGQMRWYYFDKAWQFGLGAENATAEGLTLKYAESGDDHKSLVAEEGFWIEQLVGGVWIVLEPANEVTNAPAENVQVSWSTTDTLNVNWKDSYGTLPHGFYRLGRYHTVTMPDGRTETIHCYAKFRVYDPNQDKLLAECKTALDNLLNSDSFHFYTFDWMIEHDFEYYLSTEVWKAGEDYLEVTRYPLREDLSQMKNVRGSLWRDGKHYGVQWSGEPAVSPVSSWDLGVDGYITGSNVDIALMGYEWYDAQVEEVWQDGNKYHIIQTYDFDSKYEVSELILTIDNGKIKSIVSAYLPTRNCAEEDKVISEELVIFDTSAAEIGDVIASQDVTTPMPFSYEEDVKNYPDAQKSGFKNTAVKPIATAAEALALADKESTMPKLMEFEKGYCQSMTYYDETAKMWKVHLFWWQHDTAQTVYLSDQGITQMIVSVE